MINEDGGVGYKPDAGAHLDHILGTLATTEASEMDGKMSNALRNILFGDSFQEDLCARNIFRGREMAMPSYAASPSASAPPLTPRCVHTCMQNVVVSSDTSAVPVDLCMHASWENTAHSGAVVVDSQSRTHLLRCSAVHLEFLAIVCSATPCSTTASLRNTLTCCAAVLFTFDMMTQQPVNDVASVCSGGGRDTRHVAGTPQGAACSWVASGAHAQGHPH